MSDEPLRLDDSVSDHLRQAIEDLIRCNPDSWPELLASQAGVACQMNVGGLNLLADAAVQVAALAHQMRQEAADEDA